MRRFEGSINSVRVMFDSHNFASTYIQTNFSLGPYLQENKVAEPASGKAVCTEFRAINTSVHTGCWVGLA